MVKIHPKVTPLKFRGTMKLLFFWALPRTEDIEKIKTHIHIIYVYI